MKKLLAAISFLFVLIIVAGLALPLLLPLDRVKQELEKTVTEATGREFRIHGQFSASIFPNPSISLSDVTLANASWGQAEYMARFDRLDLRLRLLPALKNHEIKVDRFIIDGLELNLEKNKDGSGNWQIPLNNTGSNNTAESPSVETLDGETDQNTLHQDFAFSLGDVGIHNGGLVYTDLSNNMVHRIDNLDIALALPGLDQKADITGKAEYKKLNLDFTISIDSPQKLLHSQPVSLDMDITLGHLATLSFKGDALKSSADLAQGNVGAEVLDLPGLIAWFTGSSAPAGIPFNTTTFTGGITLGSKRVTLDHAELKLDDITAKGTVSANFGNAVPSIKANLATGHINLDHLLAMASGASGAKAQDNVLKAPKRTKTGWSKEDIAMPAIPPLNADITAKHEGLTYRSMEMGPSALNVVIRDGKVTASMPETALQGGTVALETTYYMKNAKTPVIGLNAKMAGIDVHPVLQEFAQIDWVEGTGNAEFSLNMQGNTMERMMGTLNGQGQILFTDGVLKRFNLGAILEELKKGKFLASAGHTKHTVFDKLSGSFVIKSGSLTNNDLNLIGPKVIATGKGRVAIASQKYDYRVVPALMVDKEISKQQPDGTITTETVRVPGFEIPLMITGRFDAPKVRPDFKAIATKALQDPDSMKEQIKNLEGEVKRIKKDLKKGDPKSLIEGLIGIQKRQNGDGDTQNKSEDQQSAPDPGDLIKGLFGN